MFSNVIQHFIRIMYALAVSAVLFAGDFVLAQETTPGSPTGLTNPLDSKTIPELLGKIIDILLIFALPVVVFFIIYAGFKYVTAQGDTTQLAEARRAFVWAVVGGVIVLGANLIVDVIQGTVDAL